MGAGAVGSAVGLAFATGGNSGNSAEGSTGTAQLGGGNSASGSTATLQSGPAAAGTSLAAATPRATAGGSPTATAAASVPTPKTAAVPTTRRTAQQAPAPGRRRTLGAGGPRGVAQISQLPFTGLMLGFVALIGAALSGLGLGLRSYARP